MKSAVHLLIASLLGLVAIPAAGLEYSEGMADIKVSFFAPDWTWQRRDINILAVVRNEATEPQEVRVRLELPETNAFEYEGPLEAGIHVLAGQTVRYAFTHIRAAGDAPLRVHEFALGAACNEHECRIVYPVRVIRGAAVSPGAWALYLPAGVALLWSAVFAFALVRFSAPKAWRVPGEPIQPPGEPETWIDA
ncbi:MAG TPA: hypothetical protein ENN80_10835 [Candidatus Hydrogenedentes bacterium]|nr:hypothetical protein [Candidatus Hydrogenedentota bacterium]